MIICEDAAIEDLTINGGLVRNINNTFYTIGFQSTGYSYVIIEQIKMKVDRFKK